MIPRCRRYAAMLLGVVLIGALSNLCTTDSPTSTAPATADELHALRLSLGSNSLPRRMPDATNIVTRTEAP
jgi:hypothetical protein